MYHLKLEASHFNYFSDVSLGGFQNIVTTQGLTNATFLFLTFQGKSQNILKKKKLIDIVSFKMFFSALLFSSEAGILQDLESGPGSPRVTHPTLHH